MKNTASFVKLIVIVVFSLITLTAQTKRAVIVGIDTYKPEGPVDYSVAKRFGDLKGCVKDATAIKNILIAKYGFKEENILFLSNRDATKGNIQQAIKDYLVNPSQPGDIAFFFYAGHGSQIKNTGSKEDDQRDETLVTADAWMSTPGDVRELRDKEQSALWNQVLDKGALLTLIFDSCHSGSISRGAGGENSENPEEKIVRSRKLEPLPLVIDDALNPPAPELNTKSAGILVFSAAQDWEEAVETGYGDNTHGAFTEALMQAFATSSPTETATEFFQRTRSILKAGGFRQEPVFSGSAERRNMSLFGLKPEAVSGKTVVAVFLNKDKQVEIQGGSELGLTVGTELEQLNAEKTPVTLKVSKILGLGKALADVTTGTIDDFPDGTLFQVTKWAVSEQKGLLVNLPYTNFTQEEITKLVAKVGELAKLVKLSDDPTADTTVTHTLFFTEKGWYVREHETGNRKLASEKKEFNPYVIQKLLGSKSVTFVQIPTTVQLDKELRKQWSDEKSSVGIAEREKANYVLVGRVSEGKPSYTLAFPGRTQYDDFKTSLPVRTDWFASDNSTAMKLIERANSLLKIRSWLTLENPDGDGNYPYTASFIRLSDNKEMTENDVFEEGFEYQLVLRYDSTKARLWDGYSRFVYIFALAVDGSSTLLYPAGASLGNVENFIPKPQKPGAPVANAPHPPEIKIGTPIVVEGATGATTVVMLSSRNPLTDLSLLESGPVVDLRTKGTRGEELAGLDALLGGVGASTRGLSAKPKTVPTHWSIKRFVVETRNK